ncbi:radical SAM protein [Desulfobacter curvatus]|uniref:radical SAM protein n=1 Tax=Desulfobacter curvatus TaxID=2290 RepID=UPI0003619E0E|nr:radical SAM protein [Desulfobacter curvatus]
MDFTNNDTEKLIIYGFGRVARCCLPKLIQDFQIDFIIDNNSKYEKNDTRYNGIPIQSFMSVKHKLQEKKYKVVVAVSGNSYYPIKKQLESIGYRESIDFENAKNFMSQWYWINRSECVISRISLPITLKCTLNCKHCNTLVPYLDRSRVYTDDELKETIKMFFDCIDYVSTVLIVGGEPLLKKNLIEILSFIQVNFHEKFSRLHIISNCTIIPKDDLLQFANQNNILIRLSDYSHEIGNYDRIKKIIDKLKAFKVDYIVNKHEQWFDMGFPRETLRIADSRENLIRHMTECNAMCQVIYNKKMFFCATQLGAFEINRAYNKDILELDRLIVNSTESKKKLLDYYNGNLPKGIRFCQLCRGVGPKNNKIVTGGVQLKRNDEIKIRKPS